MQLDLDLKVSKILNDLKRLDYSQTKDMLKELQGSIDGKATTLDVKKVSSQLDDLRDRLRHHDSAIETLNLLNSSKERQ